MAIGVCRLDPVGFPVPWACAASPEVSSGSLLQSGYEHEQNSARSSDLCAWIVKPDEFPFSLRTVCLALNMMY